MLFYSPPINVHSATIKCNKKAEKSQDKYMTNLRLMLLSSVIYVTMNMRYIKNNLSHNSIKTIDTATTICYNNTIKSDERYY